MPDYSCVASFHHGISRPFYCCFRLYSFNVLPSLSLRFFPLRCCFKLLPFRRDSGDVLSVFDHYNPYILPLTFLLFCSVTGLIIFYTFGLLSSIFSTAHLSRDFYGSITSCCLTLTLPLFQFPFPASPHTAVRHVTARQQLYTTAAPRREDRCVNVCLDGRLDTLCCATTRK